MTFPPHLVIFKIMKLPLVKVITFLMIGVLALVSVTTFLYYHANQNSRATGDTVTLTFNPAAAGTGSGQDFFSTTIKAQPTSDMMIRGYVITVNFDKSKVQVKDIQYKLGVVSAGLGQDNSALSTINQNGTIKLQGEIQTATGASLPSGSATDIVTITFTSQSTSAFSVSADQSGSFYKINTDSSLTTIPVTATATLAVNGGGITGATGVTGSSGITGTPGNIILNLKLRFQGILEKPADQYNSMVVHVKLGGSPPPADCGTGTFTSDDNGVWSGTVSCNATPGPGYIVYTKGPKHIQKKICDATPTESTVGPGTYHCGDGKITLAAGTNNLDFSGILQLTGDLPVSGRQDGAVTALDTSFIRNNLGSTDPAALAIGDVNLDGKIDTQDWSLVIAALSVRGDEE